jgi:hypothetical protein
MLNSRGGTTLAGLGALALLGADLNAQPAESVAVDVGACLELETREAQVACYGELVADELDTRNAEPEAEAEAQLEAQASATDPIAASTSPSSEVEPERDLSRAERRAARRAEREQSREAERSDQQGDAVTATVTALRELEPNHWLITLDNDQVWRQNRAQRYLLEVGSEVTLRSSTWGPSYRLSDPNLGGFIQVERVR